MSPADPNTPEVEGGGRFSPEESRCPVITVLSANEHGVVIESRKAFESGATIALGLHVAIPDAGQSEFIAAEVIVVGSEPAVSTNGERVFRVTMIFSDISRQDRDLLMLVPEDVENVGPRDAGEVAPGLRRDGEARLPLCALN